MNIAVHLNNQIANLELRMAGIEQYWDHFGDEQVSDYMRQEYAMLMSERDVLVEERDHPML